MGGDSDDNHEDEMTEAEGTEYQVENPEQFLHSGDIQHLKDIIDDSKIHSDRNDSLQVGQMNKNIENISKTRSQSTNFDRAHILSMHR